MERLVRIRGHLQCESTGRRCSIAERALRRFRQVLISAGAALVLAATPQSTYGASATYEHDARGRLTKATYDDGTVVDYSYDNNGNRTAAVVTLAPDTTPPGVPGSLAATPVSQSQIDLSWAASSDNVAVTGYGLERCTGAGCASFAQIATPASTGYSDTARSPNTTYVYRVRAHDAAGNDSGYSASASATTPDTAAPSAPGTPGFGSVTMTSATASWSAASDDVGVSGYQYRLNSGSWQSLSNVLTVNLTGLSAATSYTFQVRAKDAANNLGPVSSGTFATPDTAAPGMPGTLSFTNVTMTSATASWGAATDNVGVTGYQYRLNSGSWLSIGNVLSVNFAGLTAATGYTFQVRARDAANNLGSARSGTFTTPDTVAPTTPTGLTASAPTSTKVNLSWAASSDNVAVTGYRIFRNGAQITTRTTTSYSDTAVSGTTTYSYRVSAYDAAGNNSAQSTAKSVTTPDTIAPSVPTSLTATAVSSTRVNLSWPASSDTGGSGLAGYRIYRNGSLITTRSTTSYADTSLAPNTTYSYRVSAYDHSGNVSAQSSAKSATTLGPLHAGVSSTSWSWLRLPPNRTTVSPNVVVTATGGSGAGYTYLWQRVSGDTQTSVVNATSSSVRWSRTVTQTSVTYTSVWRCRVTDSDGSTVYAPNVSVSFHLETNQ